MKTKIIALFIAIGGIVKGQYTVLHNFNDTNGIFPWGSLTIEGNRLYGMVGGELHDSGSIFSIDTNGSGYKDIFDFNHLSGYFPTGSLIFSRGKLFGTVPYGGAYTFGCVFSLDSDGANYKVLVNLKSTPCASLIILGNILYGTTFSGGTNGLGNIFAIDTNGSNYKELFDFNYNSGYFPKGLSLSGNKLYGTTETGGANNLGTIFSVDTNGNNYKDLFDCDKSGYSSPGLTVSGNVLYGMMTFGGVHDSGCIFSIDTNGKDYKDLYDFYNVNGYNPPGSLTLVGSTLYGMAGGSGIHYGDIFSIDTNGSRFNDLFNFNYTDDSDGALPWGNLTISQGVMYGMTELGGTYDYGVVFKIDTNAISTAAVNEVKANNNTINVYPNPSNGIFTLQFLGDVSASLNIHNTVEIYNVLGENIYEAKINSNNTEINISGQANGVYFYRVITETGEFIGSGKVVVER